MGKGKPVHIGKGSSLDDEPHNYTLGVRKLCNRTPHFFFSSKDSLVYGENQ